MITRYVLFLTTKDDTEGKPRRMKVTYLSAGGNNVSLPNGTRTHKITAVMEGEKCPETPPDDAHVFTVTPSCYNEWIKNVRKAYAEELWNRGD